MKRGTVCGKKWPQNATYFRRLHAHRSGLASECKVCDAEREKARRDKARTRRQHFLDTVTKASVIVGAPRPGLPSDRCPRCGGRACGCVPRPGTRSYWCCDCNSTTLVLRRVSCG